MKATSSNKIKCLLKKEAALQFPEEQRAAYSVYTLLPFFACTEIERKREKRKVCVCVTEREREREREKKNK